MTTGVQTRGRGPVQVERCHGRVVQLPHPAIPRHARDGTEQTARGEERPHQPEPWGQAQGRIRSDVFRVAGELRARPRPHTGAVYRVLFKHSRYARR